MRYTEPSTQFDKLPPNSIVAEQCLIASMMLDRDIIDQVIEMFPGSEVFYLTDHLIIYDIIAELHGKGRPVDGVIIREMLVKRDQLEEVGGTAYIAELLNTVPSSAHWQAYADTVLEKYRWREIISAANEAIRTAYSPGGIEPEEVATTAAVKFESVRDTGGSDPTITLYEAVTESVKSMRGGKPRRLPTGLNEGDSTLTSPESQESFDGVSGGFPFRQMTIVGGRPGSGKSAFVKSNLIAFAKAGWRVGIVTIEEDRLKLGDNALSHEGPVQNWKLQRSVVSDQEHESLKQLAEEFKDLPFYIDDTCTTLTQVEASLTRLKRKYECDVLVVDHLHLIQHDSGRRNETRNDQITVVSGRLKNKFRRLDVAGIIVCQLNRQGEGIENIPTMTTLREGGALEQDGDLIVFLHRRDYYRDNPATTDGNPKDHLIEINVAKNKAGGTGIAKAYWDGDHQFVGDWNNGRGHGTASRAEREKQEFLAYDGQ